MSGEPQDPHLHWIFVQYDISLKMWMDNVVLPYLRQIIVLCFRSGILSNFEGFWVRRVLYLQERKIGPLNIKCTPLTPLPFPAPLPTKYGSTWVAAGVGNGKLVFSFLILVSEQRESVLGWDIFSLKHRAGLKSVIFSHQAGLDRPWRRNLLNQFSHPICSPFRD